MECSNHKQNFIFCRTQVRSTCKSRIHWHTYLLFCYYTFCIVFILPRFQSFPLVLIWLKCIGEVLSTVLLYSTGFDCEKKTEQKNKLLRSWIYLNMSFCVQRKTAKHSQQTKKKTNISNLFLCYLCLSNWKCILVVRKCISIKLHRRI